MFKIKQLKKALLLSLPVLNSENKKNLNRFSTRFSSIIHKGSSILNFFESGGDQICIQVIEVETME